VHHSTRTYRILPVILCTSLCLLVPAIIGHRSVVIIQSSVRLAPLIIGDVYIEHDAAAMQAYLASDLGKGVVGNPNFANLTSRDFEVLSGPTTSSGGPVAASLTATASLAS